MKFSLCDLFMVSPLYLLSWVWVLLFLLIIIINYFLMF